MSSIKQKRSEFANRTFKITDLVKKIGKYKKEMEVIGNLEKLFKEKGKLDLLNSIKKAKNLEISESYEGLHFTIDGKKDSITSYSGDKNQDWEDYSWFEEWFKQDFENLKKLKKLTYLSRFASEVDNNFLNNFPQSLKVLTINNLNDLKEPLFQHLDKIETLDEEYDDEDNENANLIQKYEDKIEFVG
jgi:hypothetical protein